ncbi:MAG: hypothetical protein A2623_01085 [Caulobacterales bacterium RIFCSPHIGHO2_01_FULL_70_19]|nr:MAG: hypothetical protein A2623_01085 [Caulobacterales bacterium RIFCSPHIGHO2_01_FULL_70_19]
MASPARIASASGLRWSASLRETGRSPRRRRSGRPSAVSAASPFSARAASAMLIPAGRGSGARTTTAKATACDMTTASAARAPT